MKRYVKPTRLDAVFNGFVGMLTRLGVSFAGSRVLAVRGRTSGEWRTTPVNPLRVGGSVYLVSPRGHTQWVAICGWLVPGSCGPVVASGRSRPLRSRMPTNLRSFARI